jgi:tetratricopeptide (TPR) repeat protein
MSSEDWYRRTTWTEEDRTDFNVRLHRARKHNRNQYVRVQAAHLADVGNHSAALELLDLFLHMDEGSIDLAQVHLQRAEALLATGLKQQAICAFRASLDAERHRPNVRTEAWLLFSWFIVETQNKQLYPEAHSVITEFEKERSPLFPISNYRLQCVKALLLEHDGDSRLAKAHAQQAIALSNVQHSGFRHHPHLGLVTNLNTNVHQRVLQIAATM